MSNRKCGGCTVCCTHTEVEPFNKPNGQPCHFINGDNTGCAIYNQRPECCQQFRCAWLGGYFDEDDRPDKSGVMFEEMELGSDEGGSGLFILLGKAVDAEYKLSHWAKFCDPSHAVVVATPEAKLYLYGESKVIGGWFGIMRSFKEAGQIHCRMAGEDVVSPIQKGD